jgi:protein SCO1/2
LAAGKKAGYVAEYGRAQTAAGWHFLTGEEPAIHALTEAVGFEYRMQPDGEYSHAAAVFIITPDGRLSRVLYGVKYEQPTVRMALLEASQGKIGTTLDRIILWCHIYDAQAGGYVVLAMRVMQVGGAVTLLLLGGGLGWFWWQESQARRLAPPSNESRTSNALYARLPDRDEHYVHDPSDPRSHRLAGFRACGFRADRRRGANCPDLLDARWCIHHLAGR